MAKKKKPAHGGVRPGAGRPRKYASTAQLTIMLDAAQLAGVDAKAERLKITRTEAVQAALAAWLKAR